MTKKASFIFSFNTHKEAYLVAESLSPEIKHKIPKTMVKLSCSGANLTLSIESKDTSSLRAACNSYLRWIQTALNVKQLV